ncbi:MAG: sugar phosphate isomerase/epimerase [Acidobacteria bacterium]|nr:MAG: sugar phosphate isomerase/epimerase [Acidobacteriota bacterium]
MQSREIIDRRESLKRLAGLGAAAVATRPAHAADTAFLSDIGICTPLSNHALLRENGYAFVEESVATLLVPGQPDEKFGENLKMLQAASLPVPVCRIFLPGSLPCVGPAIRQDALMTFTETAFRRAQQAGVMTIVFGSGQSRRIPEGFDAGKAREQLISYLRQALPIAARHGVTLALEHLNRGETNMINRLSQAFEIVEEVDHPNLRMLVDIYHLLREKEAPEEILKVGRYVHHCHIAEPEKRAAPTTMKDDFRPYFTALKKVGYRGKLSIEAGWGDLATELPMALRVLRQQITEA